MKRTKKRISLRWQLFGGIIITAFGVLVIYIIFMRWVDYVYSTDTFQDRTFYLTYDYEEELQREAYDEIPIEQTGGNALIVYDIDGNVVYQSEESLNIPFETVKFYADSYANELSENSIYVGQPVYGYDRFVIIDSFTTVQGDVRFSAEVIPYQTDINIEAAQEKARWITIFGVIAGALWIFLMAMLMFWYIRRSLKPVNEAIQTYRNGVRPASGSYPIPGEFQGLIDNLNAMLDRVESAQTKQKKAEEDRIRMIADLSHDLKTPLTVISGYSGAMLDGIVHEEDKKRYLEIIHQKALYSAELMDELFAFSKMEHPDFVPDLQRIDYCELCREYLAEKYSELDLQGYPLDVQIPEEHYYRELDRNMFRRVLENLVGNIVKHNEPGTTIRFVVRESEGHLITDIADNGTGISPEIAGAVFEPFVKGDQSRKSGQGSGLGMAAAKKIVELHQGTIQLVNPPDPGVRTQIRIIL
ncbi:MAG: HAMP domain-containing histidine kinase [Parasporobacterium sp.]|nr:HAMP domain-containing histidine kinase [Parasporobacterium sp.]